MRESGNRVESLLEPILALHGRIRAGVVRACASQSSDDLAAVAGDDVGDTIYAIDRVGEAELVAGLEEIAQDEPLVLVAEGLGGEGHLVLPRGTREDACRWRILMDPIDGTRGLMFQKRSAWILTGVAPNRGAATRLRDITLAVQTEIPLLKQHLSDQLWAFRGAGGAHARRHDRLTDEVSAIKPRPSASRSLEHGFATIVRFFPGARDIMAAIDDELVLDVLGNPASGKAQCFEDQYASTGGQLYELMAGHDRFIADLRPLMQPILAERGLPRPLCCHPYDLCASLIAEELGVVVTDAVGAPLDAPFNLDADVGWIGYANAHLRARLEPKLHDVLRRRGLLLPIPHESMQ